MNRDKYEYSPEEIIHVNMLHENPKLHFHFVLNNLTHPHVEPSYAHEFLAGLEGLGKTVEIVTQNIDGLHTEAGSSKVWELHGTGAQSHCMECGKQYESGSLNLDDDGIPRCEDCGGIVRRNVVMFGEDLNPEVIQGALKAIGNAELLIIAGTSLNVYPAAGMVHYFDGDHTVLINKTPLHYQGADLVFVDGISEVFREVAKEMDLAV